MEGVDCGERAPIEAPGSCTKGDEGWIRCGPQTRSQISFSSYTELRQARHLVAYIGREKKVHCYTKMVDRCIEKSLLQLFSLNLLSLLPAFDAKNLILKSLDAC